MELFDCTRFVFSFTPSSKVVLRYIMSTLAERGPKTSKTASVLNQIETNKVKKKCYLISKNAIILN